MAMSMSMGTTSTAAAAAATSSAAMAMDMGTDIGESACQISMLWNWYTIDACFVSSSWHITSTGMFAGSCIGVVLLVMSLEFLRRAAKEYDHYILRQAMLQQPAYSEARSSDQISRKPCSDTPREPSESFALRPRTFRPSLVQQIYRAAFHMVQFGVAYFVMLLAMYYNGYILLSIVVGAFLGAFVFSWETITLSLQALCYGAERVKPNADYDQRYKRRDYILLWLTMEGKKIGLVIDTISFWIAATI